MRHRSGSFGLGRAAASLFLAAIAAACGGDDDDGDDGDPVPDAGPPAAAYVVSSTSYAEVTTSYVSVLSSLDAQTIDYDQAREFAGGADMWVIDGSVFMAEAETQRIIKFSVEGGELVEGDAISFVEYGVTDFGYWRNVFISPTKAYFHNGTYEYIVWNPQAMEIVGTFTIPELEEREGLVPFPGYLDRAGVIRDGRLYHSYYWTDPSSYFLFTPDSAIAVIDVETDSFVEALSAPCPGLDYASVDAGGDIYFSSWVYAPGGALVLDQPSTCAAVVGADGSVTEAFAFADVADGREGAALHFQASGGAFMAVLHGERVEIGPMTDPASVALTDNWRFWTWDPEENAAVQVDAIDWNGGGHYTFEIDGRTLMLTAKSDYSATTVYDISDLAAPEPLFDTVGWSTRLFKIR